MTQGYFSPELFKFLSQLKKNNDRKWFKANKQRFEDSVRDPFLNFIADHPAKWKTVLRSKTNFGEYSLVRPPRGFDADHPFLEDIKRTSYVSSVEYSEKQICSSKFMEEFISDCRSMNALMKFLADAAGVAW